MPNTKVLSSVPDVLHITRFVDTLQLPIHGQGVFLFRAKEPLSFTFYNKDKSDGLTVDLTPVRFTARRNSISNMYLSQSKTGGLLSKEGAYYWFSLDSQNQRLQGGVGEPRVETATYIYQFEQDKLWEANKVFLESLTHIDIPSFVTPLCILKNPITQAVPMKVRHTNDLTMADVAGTEYLPNAALSSAGQTLYNCIAGPKFTLNTADFPDFSDAIEYSIKTPGLWCNTRLKEKATEFGKDPEPLETYLRITLSENNGDSPGIPYVMEIWPVGHYSPIHNHSSANAVIRVLHGSIHVSLYPFLCNDTTSVEPFATKDFVKDDITWVTPTLNQVHMLKNLDTNTEACITIQCYMYDSDDTSHYDYFDYLGKNNEKAQYEPDSDMEFLAFKEKMRSEWDARPRPAAAEPIVLEATPETTILEAPTVPEPIPETIILEATPVPPTVPKTPWWLRCLPSKN